MAVLNLAILSSFDVSIKRILTYLLYPDYINGHSFDPALYRFINIPELPSCPGFLIFRSGIKQPPALILNLSIRRKANFQVGYVPAGKPLFQWLGRPLKKLELDMTQVRGKLWLNAGVGGRLC